MVAPWDPQQHVRFAGERGRAFKDLLAPVRPERTPEDEHYGRGEAICAARRAGLAAAHRTRIATRRQTREDHP